MPRWQDLDILRKEDAIRIDIAIFNGKKHSKIYIFECKGCSKEMRVPVFFIPKRTGYCSNCVGKKHRGKPYKHSYLKAKHSAKARKLDFSLTYEDFEFLTQIGMCHYCAGPIRWVEWDEGPSNLDRKDNNKGYTTDNVVVCCPDCNWKRRDCYSYDEFKAISEYLRIWRSLTKEGKMELEYSVLSFNDIMEPRA